jgi:hypothetical protein
MADILTMLEGAAGGGGAPADLPPSIPDPEAGMLPPESAGGGDEVGTLKEMLGLADTYKSLPTVTEQERAKMEKATTVLQDLLASNEKMSEQLTGAAPAMRKAFGPVG